MYAVDRINSSYRAVWKERPSYNFFFVSVQLLSRKPVFFSITRHIIPKNGFFVIRFNTCKHFTLPSTYAHTFFFRRTINNYYGLQRSTRKKESVLNCCEWLLLHIIFFVWIFETIARIIYTKNLWCYCLFFPLSI